MNDVTNQLPAREEIAIVGMAGRFPGANSVTAFWENLKNGVESIRPFTTEELQAASVTEETLKHPDFVNAGAVMDDPEAFDAGFFGMSPREAEITDPQHRVFLECAWEALEHAGYDPERYEGLISVFGGVAPNTYFQKNLTTHGDLLETLGNYPVMIGNEREYALTRVAFKLNLTGPSFSVNTACSTSGVALHLACQSLLSGECDLALAGGARIRVPLSAGYLYQQDGILSPDGKCRAFDAEARGTVIGSGAALLVLKRLSDALEEGDTVHAVVKSTAVNNDGAHKVGFTAPSVQGQAAVIAEAHALADITADTVGYVEAHGTATSLGDPIEVAALTQAFRETTDERGYCPIGSVKTNIGHLDAGAGAAGIIKTVMALQNGVIPPSLNFEKPNPQIDFANSPFYVNDKLREWSANGTPRRAGVSTFGLGGTNAHIVLEEAPEPESPDPSRPYQLLLLSARSEEALERATTNLADHIAAHPEQALADVAYTLQVGRRGFRHRRVLVTSDTEDAVNTLRERTPRRILTGEQPEGERSVAFMFPGGGAQHVNMALDIYQHEPLFRHWVDTCAEKLEPSIGLDLRTLLFPEAGKEEAAQARLEQPSLALPTLLSVEYALSQLWMSWGVQPAAVIGHSAGEYAAACLAGVISLDDALAIVTKRGQLFETLPDGSMLSVPLSVAEVEPFMSADLSVAAVNRPDMCVVSGPTGSVDALAATLDEHDFDANRLHISVAAHSDLVEPILEEFGAFLKDIDFNAPTLPYVSNVTGTWADADEVQTATYWVEHLRQTVRFSDGLETLCERPDLALLEVGPGQALSAFARHHPARDAAQAAVPSSRHPRENVPDLAFILSSLGRLWQAGVEIDWRGFYAEERRQRVPLPSYPFERQRYWLEPQPLTPTLPAPPSTPTPSQNAGAQATPTPSAERTHHVQANPTPDSRPLMSAPATPRTSRKDRVIQELKEILSELSGLAPEEMETEVSFLELGFDSLMLTQANSSFRKALGVKVSFRQLLEDAATLSALADFIEPQLAPDLFAEPEPVSEPESVSEPAPSAAPTTQAVAPTALSMPPVAGGDVGVGSSALEAIVAQQLQLMNQQLNLLQTGTTSAAVTGMAAPVTAASSQAQPNQSAQSQPSPSQPAPNQPSTPPRPAQAKADPQRSQPAGRRALVTDKSDLSPKQQAALEALTERYTTRTGESKRKTQEWRSLLADNRTVAGFNVLWKEMVYQLVAERSKGSRLWDVDGNEYVDVTLCFGANLLGHSPDFVVEAVEEQLHKGYEVGLQTDLVGEVCELMQELTGNERITFSHSGCEAVQYALRVARTVTARDKVVLFEKDIHGRSDTVLGRTLQGKAAMRTMPRTAGVPKASVEHTLVLEYGTPETLEIIRQQAQELAAVLIEPVRTRNPDLQPDEFLREVRKITEEAGTLLIFDEVVMGFRVAPGGAQEHFGVRADLVTYGKVLGGGMPIGALAGKAEYIDVIDGGMWQFGDASVPEVGMTVSGGTMIKHPISMAASRALLRHLKEQGPSLQQDLAARTRRLAKALNAHYQRQGIPVHLEQFSSYFLPKFTGDTRFEGLFYCYLRDKGVHIYLDYPCFLSTAHSDEDIDFVIEAFKAAANEMVAAGFLESHPGSPGGPTGESKGEALVTLRGDGSRTLPLTEAQREIWLSSQMGADASCSYNLSNTVHLRGPLNVSLLNRAVQQLVARHEALRLSFKDGETQTIAPSLQLEVPLADHSDLSPEVQAERLEALLTETMSTPFDLSRTPLLRLHLVKQSPDVHLLLFTAHHSICDGWTLGALTRDLSHLYSKLEGRPVTLPGPMQYSDYVLWLAEQQEDVADAADYWLAQYETLPAPLDLPTDRSRPPLKTYPCAQASVTLPRGELASLQTFATEQGTTLFSTLLAVYAVMLHKLSAQNDFAVGVFAAGQSAVGNADLAGHCVSMLPVRCKIEPGHTLADVLRTMKFDLFDAFDHQIFTFGSLLKRLDMPRDPSRMPLVSTTVTLETPTANIDFADLETSLSGNSKRFCTFDLEVYFSLSDTDLKVMFQYNTDLFDAATVQRWLGYYTDILGQVVTGQEEAVADLVLRSESEQRRLKDRNDTASDYPDRAVYQLFEAQVKGRGDAPAVTFEGETLSYEALNARANQLARHLQLEIGPGDLVGICLERSTEMLVALLAVHKAGGAYVPLDPSFPEERLAFMLGDAQVKVLLTQEALLGALPVQNTHVVCLGRDWESIAGFDTTDLSPSAGLDDLAYVIYTSGSTGKPKGVMVPHRAFTNFICSVAKMPGMSEADKLLAVTTLSFDIAGLELFLPLAVGAHVEMVSREVASDGLRLKETVEGSGVTVMQATPATWYLLLGAGWQGSPDLKVLCGGEAFPRDLADALLGKVASLWNMYGPTETTIWSAVSQVTPDDGPVLIGEPIANTQLYVLDAQLNPVPTGVPGELYIGGDGLAKGYLNRPELSAERFVDNPLSGTPGERLYKTGDLVKVREGGTEFLGRTDFQVKVRGYRIELGEIEAALNRHEDIGQAVVIVREDIPGDKRLVGYLTATRHVPTVAELRSFLQQTLPEYMTPSAFVTLDAFPLTPNNKVDRKALPVPELRSELDTFIAPRTETERTLTTLWRETLGLGEVGVNDNFFELGGDSMLVMQVVTRAQKVDLSLTPNLMFRYQTIASLAEHALNEQAVQAEQGAVVGDVPLTPAQHRFWERNTPDPHHWNISTLLESRAPLEPTYLAQAVSTLLRHHDALRLRFSRGTWGGQQRLVAPEEVTDSGFSSHDLSDLSPEEQRVRVEQTCTALQSSLDLENGPTLRVAHFDLGPEQPHRLFAAVHHFAIDALSWNVFWDDFWSVYEGLSRGEAPQLPRKTTSFKRWARDLYQLAQSEEVTEQLTRWLALPWHNVRALPRDLSGTNTNGSARVVKVSLDEATTRALFKMAKTYRMEEVLSVALSRVLAAWTGTDTVLFDLLRHGRDMSEQTDLSRTVGFFIGYAPMLARLDEVEAKYLLPTVAAQFREVSSLGASHDLLRYLCQDPNVQQKMRALPRAEVLLNYWGHHVPTNGRFAPAREARGPGESPDGRRYYPLSISSGVTEDQLRATFVYSQNVHEAETVETLASTFIDTLVALTKHQVVELP